MKKLLPLSLFISIAFCGYSQFTIQSGATVTLEGSATLVLEDTDLQNQGTLDAQSGSKVQFTGSSNSNMTLGGDDLHDLEIAKNGGNVILLDNAEVLNELSFAGSGGKVELGAYNLTLGASATVSGAGSGHYVATTGTGEMIKTNLSSFEFPVGADLTTYNPITIAEAGTPDNLGVRVLDDAYDDATISGTPIPNVVKASWIISEITSGGSDLTVTPQWAETDEGGTFDRADSGVARFDSGTDWDLSPGLLGMSGGTDPYTRSASGYEPGVFVVSGEELMNTLLLNVNVKLQGPLSGINMNDQIRAAGNLPSSTPYGSGKFSNVGRGGGEVAGPNAFDANGDDSVVDWVFFWLKDKVDPSITYQTKSALLQKDGDIVDLDGVSFLEIPGDAEDYHIGIGHRNHLSVRTASPIIGVNEDVASDFDFSISSSQAFGTNPMADISGVFALWGGNTSGNNNVRATGPPFINDYSQIINILGSATGILTNQYADQDVNMDGTIRATGPPFLNDYSKLIGILGSPTTIITEQF
ncbi:MAG: hypothetical protein HKN16_06340 [Saprospiraceae bacterium]|nr:hypothetical protein [Saprospiraceae bacterium]